MTARLKQLSAPPVFANDEDKTRIASILNVVLWSLLAATLAYAFLAPIDPTLVWRRVFIIGPLLALLLWVRALMLRGHVRLAGFMTVFGLWLTFALGMRLGGGFSNPSFIGFLVVVVAAGLLLGRRATLVWGVVCVITSALLVGFNNATPISPPTPGMTNLTIWLAQSVYIFAIAVMLTLALRRLDDALARARQELAERQRMEHQLRTSEESYRAFVALSADGIYRVEYDPPIDVTLPEDEQIPLALRQGYIAECNEALAAQYGLTSAAEMIARPRSESPQASEINRQFVRHGYRSVGAEFSTVGPQGNLKTLSVNASGVVENGKLVRTWNVQRDITERKQAEAALQRYAVRMEILHNIDRAILSARSPEETAEAALSFIRQLIPGLRAGVTLLEPRTHQMVLLAVNFTGTSQWGVGARFPFDEAGELIERLRHGQPIVVEDVLALSPRQVTYDRGLAEGIRSWLHAPLIHRGELFGALSVGAAEPGTFKAEHVEVAREVADQMAIAIQQARLFEAEQRRVALLTALHETGLDLSAQLDLPILLQTIIQRAIRLLDAPRGTFYLVEPDGQMLTLAASHNLASKNASAQRIRLGEGLSGRVAQTGEPMVVADYTQWPDRLASLEGAPYRAMLAVPIKWQERVLGTIGVLDDRPARFGPDEVEIVRLFAAQAAVAIQNARLFETTRRQLDESTTLHAVAIAAAHATSEDQLIERATQIVGDTLFQDYCGVLVVDHAAGVLRVHPSHRGMSEAMKTTVIALGQGVTGTVALRGQVWRISDVRQEPTYIAANPDMRSELCVPLKIGERVLGVFNVESPQVEAFREADERLLTIIAGQLAPAIERLRAHAEIRALNAELEQRVADRTAQLEAQNANLQRVMADLQAVNQLAEQRARELADLNASKDRFFSILAHDLRGPFTNLMLSSQLLERVADTAAPDRLKRIGENLHQSARNVYNLLENLLQWSRLQLGRMEHHPSPLDVQQLVQRNLRLFNDQALRKDVELLSRVAAETFVYADENMLDTVLRNLISNALKFTPSGGRVTIAAQPSAAADEVLELTVSDTGLGIAAEDVTKLFKIGVQHTTPGIDQERGSGLGLILCHEMTVKNGGQIWVESEPGRGTTVRFTVPIDRPGIPADQDE